MRIRADYRRLIVALNETPRGQVPCLDEDPEVRAQWTSHRTVELQQAAEACRKCPVLALCREVGREERAGTWGGRIKRHPKEREPRSRKAAAA